MSSELEAARAAYAAEICRSANVRTEGLARGLATVRREDFLGPGPWQLLDPAGMGEGYCATPDDDPIHLQARVLVAIDAERALNNGDPQSLLAWLDTLELRDGERLLHVGCGVGYYTAIAACALGPAGEAVGIEIDPGLARRASRNLAMCTNARVETGDGSAPEPAGFDAIFVNAGATGLTAGWLAAVREGGRLLVPLTVARASGSPKPIGVGAMLLVKRTPGDWPARFVSPVGIFHCSGARDPEEEQDLQKAFNAGEWPSVRALRFDAHPRDEACWLHGSRYCLTRREPLEPGS